ncbi:hypothetical protein DOK78_000124 [Enterococcus sp. DIV2402]|uniref:RpiR family transcriptional regulator n=1 Tax=Candidatus Enterococcus lowellii TaxID=2230877 RepID=A0ABZ2SMW4_9ENTE|nr:MurR/RpiR family transcriptional regulator [Enterococcus sp. DIV2402]MBO0463151.1 MurR/RpiR family transcriptional regulator [Enterococcus sp. DIV2402]
MQSLINKLQKKRPQLSELEKQVFDYILRNPTEIKQLTIDELAAKLFLSTATISRTAKHLGFKGFQELKYAIAQYSQTERGERELTNPSIISLSQSIQLQLSQTLRLLQQAPIKEIVDALYHAKVIEIFGVGGSLPNCIEAARKLTFLGKKANARIDWDEQQAVSKSLSCDDLAIIVSNSGETIHIIEYALNLQQNNVPVLAIVGTENSRLETLATHTLQASVDMIYFEEVDLSSRVSLSAILDILLIQLAGRSSHE